MDADGSSAKRRHSRPLELDSEGEEEVDTSGKEEESLSDREEEPDETEATDRLLSGKVSNLKNELPLIVGLSFTECASHVCALCVHFYDL